MQTPAQSVMAKSQQKLQATSQAPRGRRTWLSYICEDMDIMPQTLWMSEATEQQNSA